MISIDLSLFAKNVKVLCKEKDIMLSTVEEQSGLSIGYLSRLRANRAKDFSLNVAYRISKLLDVPIEELCECDFEERLHLKSLLRERDELKNKLALIEQEIQLH